MDQGLGDQITRPYLSHHLYRPWCNCQQQGPVGAQGSCDCQVITSEAGVTSWKLLLCCGLPSGPSGKFLVFLNFIYFFLLFYFLLEPVCRQELTLGPWKSQIAEVTLALTLCRVACLLLACMRAHMAYAYV